MEFENDFSLKEWAKDKPLSILQLDPADRAVLRIADIPTLVPGFLYIPFVEKPYFLLFLIYSINLALLIAIIGRMRRERRRLQNELYR